MFKNGSDALTAQYTVKKPKKGLKLGTGDSNIADNPEILLINKLSGRERYFETYTELHSYLTKIGYLKVSLQHFIAKIENYLYIGPKDDIQHVYKFKMKEVL